MTSTIETEHTTHQGSVHSARRSIRNAFAPIALRTVTVVDLFSPDDLAWREHVAAAANGTHHPVILSSAGLSDGPNAPQFHRVLAERERQATATLPGATLLRLAPVIEDLGVYKKSVQDGETIFHAYPECPSQWVSAYDVAEFAGIVDKTPQRWGSCFELYGAQSASAQTLLNQAISSAQSKAKLVEIPPEILQDQLARLFGDQTAHAIVGHQLWVGSEVCDVAGHDILGQALDRPQRSWRESITELLA